MTCLKPRRAGVPVILPAGVNESLSGRLRSEGRTLPEPVDNGRRMGGCPQNRGAWFLRPPARNGTGWFRAYGRMSPKRGVTDPSKMQIAFPTSHCASSGGSWPRVPCLTPRRAGVPVILPAGVNESLPGRLRSEGRTLPEPVENGRRMGECPLNPRGVWWNREFPGVGESGRDSPRQRQSRAEHSH